MDTLLGSSRYTMGKALTSGPHHLQGPWNGSWATAASHTTRAAAFGELLFILLSPFHFSRQLSNLTKYPFNFFSQMTQKPWYNLTRPKNQTRKIRIPANRPYPMSIHDRNTYNDREKKSKDQIIFCDCIENHQNRYPKNLCCREQRDRTFRETIAFSSWNKVFTRVIPLIKCPRIRCLTFGQV